MPTPSDDTLQFPSPHDERLVYATCPLENERPEAWRTHNGQVNTQVEISGDQFSQRPAPSIADVEMSGSADDTKDLNSQSRTDGEPILSVMDAPSPMTVQGEAKQARESLSPSPTPSVRATTNPSMSSYEFSSIRVNDRLRSESYCSMGADWFP